MLGRFLEWLIVAKLARWFPSRYRLIPRAQDGAPLLRQFRLFGSWCYLQSFENPEVREWFHRHRWERMISIVLSGAFKEERYPGGIFVVHRAGSIYSMDRTVVHRLSAVKLRTWTLFFMFGPRARRRDNRPDWGYYPRPKVDGFVEWDKMIPDERKVKSL